MKTQVTPIPVPHLCVVTAVDIEFNAVVRQLTNCIFPSAPDFKICRGRAARNMITVLQSQIGAVDFRERLIAFLHQTKFDAVLMIGLAGALSPALKTGEVIFYDTCFLFQTTAEDEARGREETTVCDFQMSSSLQQTLADAGQQAVFGAGLTLDFMLTRAQEKLAMGESSQAAAVDMESYEIVRTANQMGVPVIVLRVILDEAAQTTPDFNIAVNADGKIHPLKAGLAMLLRPFSTIIFLLSLRRAVATLQQVTKIILNNELKFEPRSTALVLPKRIWS